MSLSQKDPDEVINITFDYSSKYSYVKHAVDADPDHVGPDPEVTVTLKGDTVDIPAMKVTSPIVLAAPNDNKVVISIQGGISGNQYNIRCTATTDTNEIIVVKDVLSVKTL